MSGLSFLAPMYLLGALAIAVPLLLHLYRRRTEDNVHFPSIAWLEAVPVETQQRRRVRDWLLLALGVAALALLAAALERGLVSGRGYDRVRRVERTVADLAGREAVDEPDVAEALSYRGTW